MKNFTLIFILLTAFQASAQISAVIKDSETREAIPFVNILFENEWVGVSADQNGKFRIATPDEPKIMVFSAVGYESRKISSDAMPAVVLMKPAIIELREAIVSGRKKRTKRKYIPFFEKDTKLGYNVCDGFPWMTARFFPYSDAYNRTPFIDGLEVFAKTNLDSAKFNIRLCLPDKNGKPGKYMTDRGIIAQAIKGQAIVRIDLSDEYLVIPEEGFFIILEWLIIEENKKFYSTKYEGENVRTDRPIFEPIFGAVPTDSNQLIWTSVGGGWRKPEARSQPATKNKEATDQYLAPAVNLLLSN